MSYYQPSPNPSQNGYEHRTTFPDILSAPAPVLRDDDILIDGETVAEWEDPRTSFARPSPVNTASTPSYYYPSSSSTSNTTSPAMSSLTTSPTGASPPAATQPSPSSFARPPPTQSTHQAAVYDPYSPRDNHHHSTHHYSNDNRQSTVSPYPPRQGASSSGRNYHQSSAVVLHRTRDVLPGTTRPPEVERMRSRRKVATAAAGVVGGIAGLAVLGPVGALAGGVGGAMLTKHAGKRMERKQTERIAAQRHAVEEQRYGRTVLAVQADSALT